MKHSPRCLYSNSIANFIIGDEDAIFGALSREYHGETLTTTREAWDSEIAILRLALSHYAYKDAKIVFEYDIPRLGKRIDVVLLSVFEGLGDRGTLRVQFASPFNKEGAYK